MTEMKSLNGAAAYADPEALRSRSNSETSNALSPSGLVSGSKPKPGRLREQMANMQYILLNTTCTVAIVFMNKSLLTDPQLRKCQVLMAMWHFAVTATVLYIASRPRFAVFEAVRLPLIKMLPISAFFAGFILLSNFSLALNPVGFYQLAKIMATPAVVFLNFVLFRKAVSGHMLLAILSVCFGVALTTAELALSNPFGAVVAIAAFFVTALYQIWIGKEIVDLNVSAPQLLLNQAPVSVLILMFIVPFVDTIPDLSKIPANVLWVLFWSGIVASVLNLSQFLIIGRTSALTFNIVGNLKSLVILSLSWYRDSRVPTLQEAVGVTFALAGAYAYSQLAQKPSS